MIRILTTLLFLFAASLFASLEGVRLSHASDRTALLPYSQSLIPEHEIRNPSEVPDSSSSLWKQHPTGIYGRIGKPILSRFVLINDTDETQTKIIQHPRPGIDQIGFWILDESGQILKQWQCGDLYPIETRPVNSIHCSFPLTISPHQSFHVITQIQTYGVSDISWELLSESAFKEQSRHLPIWWGMFIGVLLVLIFYNAISYFATYQKPYAVHFFYAVMILLTYTGIYGVLYYADIVSNLAVLNMMGYLTACLAVASHLFYPVILFDLKTPYPKLAWTLIGFSGLIALAGMSFVFGVWYPSHYLFYSYLVFPVAFNIFLTLGVALFTVYHKMPGARYYLLAQIFVVFAGIYASLAINTHWLKSSMGAVQVISLAAIMEVLFITVAMGARIKKEMQEKEFHQSVSRLYERYIYVGSYTSDIIHQWKVPLGRLGSIIASLSGHYRENVPLSHEKYGRKIQELEQVTTDLKQIADDVYGYLSQQSVQEEVALQALLERVILYLGQDGKHITFEFIGTDCTIKTHRAALSQILLTLLSNSARVLKNRKIDKPKVVFEWSDGMLLVRDNAGGINKELARQLFEPFRSGTGGLGSGLFVARKLAKKKLHGDLVLVKNGKEGAVLGVKLG